MTEAREAPRTRYLEGLRPMRKKAGLTQQELAAATGTTKQSISMWEAGDRWPSAEWLPKLAAACGCRLLDLYGPADQQEAEK
ncbi:MAG: helix-turn-helix domain-containing protein [Oscillospiraceae bacterium]|nr:helix-turn-helix domain-containing protein [Oscillospiraceae bacterium]